MQALFKIYFTEGELFVCVCFALGAGPKARTLPQGSKTGFFYKVFTRLCLIRYTQRV